MPLGVLGVLKSLSGFREKGDVYRLWLCAFSQRAFGVSCVTWLFFFFAEPVRRRPERVIPCFPRLGLSTFKSVGHLLSGRGYCWVFRAPPMALPRFFGEPLSRQATPPPHKGMEGLHSQRGPGGKLVLPGPGVGAAMAAPGPLQ